MYYSVLVMLAALLYMCRLRFPFQVESYKQEPTHPTPSPLEANQLHSDPASSVLRLHYHVAMVGDVDKLMSLDEDGLHDNLDISTSDIVALKSLHIGSVLSNCFGKLQVASSHEDVISWLLHLGVLLQASNGRKKSLKLAISNVLDWKQMLQRYI